MKIANFFTLLLFFTTLAYAKEDVLVIDGGIGVSASNGLRFGSMGIQENLWYSLKQRATIGGWIDNGSNRNDSLLLSGQLGFEVQNGGMAASIFSGPCAISSPDSYLGGYFQFMTDLHLGIYDRDSNYFGVIYRHISSAGIETPNIGRDMAGLEIRF